MHNGIIKQIKKTAPPKQLSDRFMLESRAVVFPQFHFLFEVFDKKFQQYLEADLIEYNLRAWKEENNLKKLEQYKEPFEVLTLGDLEAGFVVWLVPLFFSILIFGIEWLPTLHKLIVFLFVFKTFYKLRKSELKARNAMVKIKIHKMQVMKRAKSI